jgi:hypothetical protein
MKTNLMAGILVLCMTAPVFAAEVYTREVYNSGGSTTYTTTRTEDDQMLAHFTRQAQKPIAGWEQYRQYRYELDHGLPSSTLNRDAIRDAREVRNDAYRPSKSVSRIPNDEYGTTRTTRTTTYVD